MKRTKQNIGLLRHFSVTPEQISEVASRGLFTEREIIKNLRKFRRDTAECSLAGWINERRYYQFKNAKFFNI